MFSLDILVLLVFAGIVTIVALRVAAVMDRRCPPG
jgi:hypothetical protein